MRSDDKRSPLSRKLVLALVVSAGIAIFGLIASAATGFSLELQREGVLVPGAGKNNDFRASTTDFTQVDTLDWWSFPTLPCCRCSLDLTFNAERLASFQRHCNYAPEVP